jgi:hypothetical protein
LEASYIDHILFTPTEYLIKYDLQLPQYWSTGHPIRFFFTVKDINQSLIDENINSQLLQFKENKKGASHYPT